MRPANALHYDSIGPPAAPAILLLHGITGSRRYWSKKIRPLAREFRLIVPDLIGFGLSPKPHVEYTIELFRDSVRALVEELGLQDRPLILIGHSLGGLVALEYAARYSGHVTRMILLSLPRFESPASAHAVFWRGSPHYRRLLNQQSLQATLAQMKRSGLEITLRYILRFPLAVLVDSHKFTFKSLTSTLEHCLLNYQVDRVLPLVPRVPTLLIHGEQDSVAPLAHVVPISESYPFVRLVTLRGTGHHLFLTHTRRCLDLFGKFLREGASREELSTMIRSEIV